MIAMARLTAAMTISGLGRELKNPFESRVAAHATVN
jgi:hypothetical protein